MSNKMNTPPTIRWQLLSTASALALLGSACAADAAGNDAERPTLWIEFGGQMENISGQGEPFTPPFLFATPTPPVLSFPGGSDGPPPSLAVLRQGTTPVQAQKPPFSFGEEAKVSFEPADSDWVLSAAIRIGRSSNFRHVDHQTKGSFHEGYKSGHPKYPSEPPNSAENFADTQVHHKENHAILDFLVGKDVGLGLFGREGSSIISAGVRFAQFASRSAFDIRARPDLQFKYQTFAAFGHPSAELKLPVFHTYHATGQASRSFQGMGPSLSWNGSASLAGNPQDGEATFDWGAGAAALFGKQKARVRHQETAHYVSALDNLQPSRYQPVYHHTGEGHAGTRNVIVPNVGGFAGLSYRYADAKISFGYRADFFFGAIDGGIDARKSETLGFKGPFASISVGLGD
jgi:iron complex outermembrane recepter protein